MEQGIRIGNVYDFKVATYCFLQLAPSQECTSQRGGSQEGGIQEILF